MLLDRPWPCGGAPFRPSGLTRRAANLSIERDIRERKAAEQARREAYHILEQSPVVAFLWRNAPHWPAG